MASSLEPHWTVVLAGKFGEARRHQSTLGASPRSLRPRLTGQQRKLEAVNQLTALAEEAGVR